MPRGDRTGPAGMGPMTGRGAGSCAGYSVPGFANSIPGRGYGLGFGRGMGMGFGFRGGRGGRWAAPNYQYGYSVPYVAPPTPQQEGNALQEQAEYLENSLAEIKKRLAELRTETPKE